MTIVYRTAGAWGPGKGANLTAAEIDGNFHDLNTRLTEVETNPPEPAEIQSITSSGSALTITVSDGRVIGPLAIGSAALVYKGNWLAATVYKKNDIVVANGSEVYYVAVDHTSAATFDAGRVISGTTVYQLMMNAYDAALEAVGWALTAGSHSGISFTEQPDGSVDAAVDFSAGMEAYQDAIATAFALGTKSGISITYDDTNNRFDFSVTITQYTDELAQDAAAALLTTGTHSGISFSYNDAGNALNATVSVAFADLTDVPSGYSGQGGRLLAVKGDASGLEFRSPNELVPPAAVPRFMGCMATLASSLIGVNYSAAANIPWTAEAFDTDGFHDNVTNNTRLTIPAGLGIKKVRLSAVVRFANMTAGSDNNLSISKNGVFTYLGNPGTTQETSAATTGGLSICSGPIPVVDGDYFEVNWLTSDTSIDLDAARCAFMIEVLEVEGGVNLANVLTEATTARTLGMADINDHLLCTNASPVTITVPANATTAIPIGATMDIEQNGAGQVTISPAVGVTVNKPSDRSLATRTRYSVVRLRKVAINTWTFSGDMA